MKRRIAKVLSLAALTIPMALASTGSADPIGGAQGTRSQVEAFSTRTYRVECWAGEVTRVIVDGDRDTDLDVYVRDSSGRLLGMDEDCTDTCVVLFRPDSSGPVRIDIVNRGRVYNRFDISVD